MLEVDVGSRLVATWQLPWIVFEDSSTHQITQKKRSINQTTIALVGEHNYEWPHIDDGILDIEGWHPTKQIVTKRLGWNIITTFRGIETPKAEEGHDDDDDDDDDDDNDVDIPNEAIEAPNDSDYHEP